MFHNIEYAVTTGINILNGKFHQAKTWLHRNEQDAAQLFLAALLLALISAVTLVACIIVAIVAPLVAATMRALIVLTNIILPIANILLVAGLMTSILAYFFAFYAEKAGLSKIFNMAFPVEDQNDYYPEQVFALLLEPAPERVSKKVATEVIENGIIIPPTTTSDDSTQQALHQELRTRLNEIALLEESAKADAKRDIQADHWFQALHAEPEQIEYALDFWTESFIPEDEVLATVPETVTLMLPPMRASFPTIPQTQKSLKRKALSDLQTLCSRINTQAKQYVNLSPIQWDEKMNRQQMVEEIFKFYAQLQ